MSNPTWREHLVCVWHQTCSIGFGQIVKALWIAKLHLAREKHSFYLFLQMNFFQCSFSGLHMLVKMAAGGIIRGLQVVVLSLVTELPFLQKALSSLASASPAESRSFPLMHLLRILSCSQFTFWFHLYAFSQQVSHLSTYPSLSPCQKAPPLSPIILWSYLQSRVIQHCNNSVYTPDLVSASTVTVIAHLLCSPNTVYIFALELCYVVIITPCVKLPSYLYISW